MKKSLLIFTLVFILNSNAQHKAVLYDFASLPQTLLINPGAEINYKSHFGVPLTSGWYGELGLSGFVLSDLFVANGVDINQKIATIASGISPNDNLKLNAQIEVLSAGYWRNNNTYLSVGFYQEFEAIIYLPNDLITLGIEGNSDYLSRVFELSQINFKADLLGVMHIGISKKINEKLTIGGRFKIYSSAMNITSTNNTGTFTTTLGSNNTYTSALAKVNLNVKSSGIYKNDLLVTAPAVHLKNSFFGGNLGAGIDVGFTYHSTPQLQFSASLLDVGFVKHAKRIKNISATGSFNFEGLEFEYAAGMRDYWKELENSFEEQVRTSENQKSYSSWRSAKLNAAIKYSYGEKRSIKCYDDSHKNVYKNAFGAQLYSIFRPLREQFAFTGFYEKSFSDAVHAKITYTLDDYSYANIGVGVSAQIRKINCYVILDNITKLLDVSKANNVSLQLGFNLIFH